MTTKAQHIWNNEMAPKNPATLEEANIQAKNHSKLIFKLRTSCDKMQRALREISDHDSSTYWVKERAKEGLRAS